MTVVYIFHKECDMLKYTAEKRINVFFSEAI
jgi:hypothetical protein